MADEFDAARGVLEAGGLSVVRAIGPAVPAVVESADEADYWAGRNEICDQCGWSVGLGRCPWCRLRIYKPSSAARSELAAVYRMRRDHDALVAARAASAAACHAAALEVRAMLAARKAKIAPEARDDADGAEIGADGLAYA